MTFAKGDAIYVDKSRANGYYVVATACVPAGRSGVDKALRALRMPGERRIHFKLQQDARRRELLAAMVALDVRCALWRVQGEREKVARRLCIEELTRVAHRDRARTLYIERDDTSVDADKRQIAGVLNTADAPGELAYHHLMPHEAPALWISDAVAWAYPKGGDWRRRVAPLLGERIYEL